MPDTARRWTREMVLALPEDGNRYELFDGELLVTPSPGVPHQVMVALLQEALAPYLRAHRLGQVLTGPADLALGGEQLSQRDLFVLPRLPPDRSWASAPDLILVVEVVSPASARGDRGVKRRRFQRAGIPEYWVVDPEARIVERWRPGDERAEVVGERLVWHPAGASVPLGIELRPLFAEALGEGPQA